MGLHWPRENAVPAPQQESSSVAHVVGGGQRGCHSCSGPLSNTLLMCEVTDFLRAAKQSATDFMLKTQNLFFHSNGGQKFKIKVLAGLAPSEGSEGASRPFSRLLVAGSALCPSAVEASLQSAPTSTGCSPLWVSPSLFFLL